MPDIKVFVQVGEGDPEFVRDLDEETAIQYSAAIKKDLATQENDSDPKAAVVVAPSLPAVQLLLNQIVENGTITRLWLDQDGQSNFAIQCWEAFVSLELIVGRENMVSRVMNNLARRPIDTSEIEFAHKTFSSSSHEDGKILWDHLVDTTSWKIFTKFYNDRQANEILEMARSYAELDVAIDDKLHNFRDKWDTIVKNEGLPAAQHWQQNQTQMRNRRGDKIREESAEEQGDYLRTNLWGRKASTSSGSGRGQPAPQHANQTPSSFHQSQPGIDGGRAGEWPPKGREQSSSRGTGRGDGRGGDPGNRGRGRGHRGGDRGRGRRPSR